MKKSIIKSGLGLFLAAILCFPLIFPTESFAAPSFKDISGHWAEKHIENAVAKGILKGYPDGKFLPDAEITRAEFVSMLNRALGNTSISNTGFKDIQRTAWYYNDVSKAVVAGFVNGFSDNTFRPEQKIARQEAAVMLARIIPGYGYSTDLRKFSDHKDIASWAYLSMSKVSGKGYISGYTDGKVHPSDSLTRAQASKIISDILKQEHIVASDPIIKKDGTKLAGTIYTNNVTVHKDLGNGSATIDNCVILGKLIVQGGGEETVTINNSRIVDSVINRTQSTVRVLAKGETIIANAVCSGNFALQTSGLSGDAFGTGFEKVSYAPSAKGSLQGTFPKVSMDGSSGELKLLSGSIGTLDINNAAKHSEITVENKASIGLTNVYSESYFKGEGTISEMQVNAKGVTYETKPKKWSINSGGETPIKTDPKLAVTFAPEEGESNVYIDTKISLTFNSAVRKKDGKAITNDDIANIVTLRKESSTGSTVNFQATINSAKTIMTLTPSSNLETKTKYYIVVNSGTVINAKDEKNESITSYFTTGSKSEKLIVTYDPANNAVNIPVNKNSFTISFSEDVTKYNGSTISVNDDYLKDKVISFKKGSSNVSTSDYTVKINTGKNQLTVTLKDSYKLSLNTKYTIGINSSSLKTGKGVAVPSSSASWTTAGTPVLSNVSTVPDELHIDFKATANVAGTIYAVLLPSDATAPSAANIKDGKNSAGAAALLTGSKSASASAATAIKLGNPEDPHISRDTSYKVFAVLYDGNGNASAVVSSSTQTLPVRLASLKITADESTENMLKGFSSGIYDYNVSVPNGTTSVKVLATPTSSYEGETIINGIKTYTNDISLSDGKATVTITIQETGKSLQTYIVEIKEKGTADLEGMTINSTSYIPGSSGKYELTETPAELTLNITPVETGATVLFNGTEKDSETNFTYTLVSPDNELKFTIESSDGVTSKEYTIEFQWELPPSDGDPGEGSDL